MGKKILVTGASGFIGRSLVARLHRSGHEVVAGVRRFSKNLGTGIRQEVIGDIAGDVNWFPLLTEIDLVIHLAARSHVIKDNAPDPVAEFRRVNVRGTLQLAEQSAEAGVGRFLFISSVGVHGNRNARPFTEADPPAPREPYALSKLEAENGLLRLAEKSGLEVVIIRPPLVYGPGAPGNLARLAKLVQRNIPLPLGAVDNKRSLVSLENLLNLILVCLEHPGAANEIFLVADGKDVSTTELIRAMGRGCGKRPLLLPVPARWMETVLSFAGKKDVACRLFGSLQVDCGKAAKLLGWQPVESMEAHFAGMASSACSEEKSG